VLIAASSFEAVEIVRAAQFVKKREEGALVRLHLRHGIGGGAAGDHLGPRGAEQPHCDTDGNDACGDVAVQCGEAPCNVSCDADGARA
jgi:hypothetical protein